MAVASRLSSNESLSVLPAMPVFACVAVAAVAWLLFSWGYIEDDAFIHLEFARSVAEGRGFSFNGQLVNGDTAPLWVLLLAGVHSSGLGWIGAAKALCGAGVALALAGVWRITDEIADTSQSKRSLAPAAVVLTALNPYFVHWSFSGMEAVAALGVGVWAIWAVFSPRPSTWGRLLVGAALLSIAPLLRPELLLLSAVAGVALLLQAWKLAPSRGSAAAAVLVLAVGMALPTAAWCAYALEAFGSIMPSTNAAKQGGGLAQVLPRLASVYLVGFAPTILLLPFVGGRMLRPAVPAAVWALLLWPAACAAFYVLDHTAVQTRYCLLSMPSLTVAVLWLLEESSALRSRARAVVAAMAILSMGILAAIVFPHVSNKVRNVQAVSTAAAYIRDQVPPMAPVAVYSIGQLAFESRHPLVDIGGITRPGVLPYLNDVSAAIRWAQGQGAQFYVGGAAPDAAARRVFSYPTPFVGWTFRRSSYDAVGETGIFRLEPPPAKTGP